jgi:predicted RND superfamily exporter protein
VSKTFDAMFEEPASAITRNALVIALGFTPLLLAPLVPYITVGIFLASIMFISALVTLLVLPAAMTLLKRWVFKEA